MEAKDIKLRRVKENEFEMRYYYDAGTKHLGAIYATKHYGYTIYDAETNHMVGGGYEENLNTLKDVKNWIIGYDAAEDYRRYENAHNDAINENEWRTERAIEDAATEAYKVPCDLANDYNIGDKIKIAVGIYSKPNKIGEGLKANTTIIGKIVHTVNITDAEFDAACDSLYNNYKEEWILSGEMKGGIYSDDPRLDGYTWLEIDGNKELTKIFMDTANSLIQIAIAPNRRPLIINTEGYNYPRYVATLAE